MIIAKKLIVLMVIIQQHMDYEIDFGQDSSTLFNLIVDKDEYADLRLIRFLRIMGLQKININSLVDQACKRIK